MKKLLMLLGLTLAANSYAAELTNYAQIKKAVVNGEMVRIALDFSNCTAEPGTTQQYFSVGVYTPNEIFVGNDGVIKTSLKHFTLNDATMPGRPVYQYVVYTIKQDNTVKISKYLLAAANSAMLDDGSFYNCNIASGIKFYQA